MKNRIISLMFCILFCMWLLPFNIVQITANAAFFKGNGTMSDPYQIATSEDLIVLSKLINDVKTNPEYRYSYYIQMNDIDMEGVEFEPIGTFYDEDGTTLTDNAIFAGNYNGNYHSIYNLNVNHANNYAGLFGRVGQANGADNTNCVISNLSVFGSVSSELSSVGGIIGELGYGATVKNCSYNGIVNGYDYVGGLVGDICAGGTIVGCYFNGEISSTAKAGGIVSLVIIGRNNYSKDAVIKNNYSVGAEIEAEISGGIIGTIKDEGKYENNVITESNYYLYTMTATGAPEGTKGCTKFSAAALKACADMLGGQFVDNNDETVNDGYPVFAWQSTPYQFKGSGTAEDPYQISNKEELETMRDLVNSTYFNPIYGHAYYVQTANIDLQNEVWIPIGLGYDDAENGTIGQGAYNCLTRMFFGQYDGNGHIITNLNVNGNYHYAGLFGSIRGAYSDAIGLVCNLVVYGTVTQNGEVNGDTAGGIVGSLQYGATLDQCAFIGDVDGKNAGGVCGYLYSGGHIWNCYHNGSVTAESGRIAGGIVGRIRFSQYNLDGEIASVRNCYHANGAVTCDNYSGGIAGDCVFYDGIDNTIDITNCYFTAGTATYTVSANATSDNTLALPENLLKRIAADLGSAYVENADETLNDGYPVFTWQSSIYVQGDVNLDGTVNVTDAVLLQKYLLCLKSFTTKQYETADLTTDNTVNAFDLAVLKRMLLNMEG